MQSANFGSMTKATPWSAQFLTPTLRCCENEQHREVLPHSRCEVLVPVSTKPIQTIPMCKTPSIYHTTLHTKAAGKEG